MLVCLRNSYSASSPTDFFPMVSRIQPISTMSHLSFPSIFGSASIFKIGPSIHRMTQHIDVVPSTILYASSLGMAVVILSGQVHASPSSWHPQPFHAMTLIPVNKPFYRIFSKHEQCKCYRIERLGEPYVQSRFLASLL